MIKSRERNWRSVWQVSDIRERHAGFWCKRLKERGRLEDLFVIERQYKNTFYRNRAVGHRLDESGSEYGPVQSCYEHGNEPSGSK